MDIGGSMASTSLEDFIDGLSRPDDLDVACPGTFDFDSLTSETAGLKEPSSAVAGLIAGRFAEGLFAGGAGVGIEFDWGSGGGSGLIMRSTGKPLARN